MTEHEAVWRLAATLLPGGAGFPAMVDTAGPDLLLQRLPPGEPARLLAALAGCGTPPIGLDTWVDAASRLEAVEPALFNLFRREAYLAYYEQPAVIAAIRATGHPYNDAPLPDGYPVAPFDPVEDTPRHGRGRWLDTDDVRRADIAGLDLESLR